MDTNPPPDRASRARRLVAGLLAPLLPLAIAACAQQSEEAPVPQPMELPGVKGALLYMPQQFDYFAPQNALDMLVHVPDFAIREGGEGEGNVLLDGDWLPAEAGSVREQLSGIPASRVLRIEVIDGSAHGIPGVSGLLANIVTEPDDFMHEPTA